MTTRRRARRRHTVGCLLVAASLAVAGIGASTPAQASVDSMTARHRGSAAQWSAYACRQDVHPQDSRYPGVHVASLETAPNGDLLYSFYAGKNEGADDVATYMSRMRRGTSTWTEPKVIFDEPGEPDGNAVLWADGKDTYMFFNTIRGSVWADSDTRMIRSHDSGRTWTGPKWIRKEWGWLVGTKPLKMSNGQTLLPIYSETDWTVGWYRPSDGYTTWTPLPGADDSAWPSSPNGSIQPTTVELEPGHLMAYLRTRDGWIYRTDSFDYGRSWTTASRTSLPNNNSRIALLKLRDGHLVLALNPTSDTTDRSTLQLLLSSDNGRSWGHARTIESEAGAEFSYPYLTETRDGMIQLGYTHRRASMRHVVLNEAFITRGRDLPSDADPVAVEYKHGRLAEVNSCSYVNRGGSAAR